MNQSLLFTLISSLLTGILVSPVFAQNWKKLPEALENVKPSVAKRLPNNPALENALRLSQAARAARIANLTEKLELAMQGIGSSPISPATDKENLQTSPGLNHPQKQNNFLKTPEQWVHDLEAFIQLHNRYPDYRSTQKEEKDLALGIRNLIKSLNRRDPLSKRVRNLHNKYPIHHITKTPEQWQEELEAFIREKGRYPFATEPLEEKTLYTGITSIVQRLGPDHPISQRIAQLRKQYPPLQKGKSPQQWLDELEAFVAENGRTPSCTNAQEKALYAGSKNTVSRLGWNDPIAQRIIQLYKKYSMTK